MPFKGDLRKPVFIDGDVRPSSAEAEKAEMAKRAHIVKEVSKGFTDGPRKTCPYPAARPCKTSTTEKDKYDPESDRLRLISNFSAREKGKDDGSVNDCSETLDLMSFHARPDHIRDTLMWLFMLFGPGILAWTADIPSCFRLLPLAALLLPLFVYQLNTAMYGVEWFVDLVCPFGWAPSEWAWQCVLALILWRLRKDRLGHMFAYVDNFFYLFHPKDPFIRKWWGTPSRLYDAIERVFQLLDVPLHEFMIGTRFKGLGWMWDLTGQGRPVMECAEDKFAHLCRKLREWAPAHSLTYKEIERAIGFLTWISAGFTLGRPHLAYLRMDLAKHRSRSSDKRHQRHSDQDVTLSAESREALRFWGSFFPRWNRRCHVFLDYGPMAGPEVLWRVDASTRWGMGAIMWEPGAKVAYFVQHRWTARERRHAFSLQRESTGVLEAMAAAICVLAFARASSGKRVLLEVDHHSLSLAVRRSYSGNDKMMAEVKKITMAVAREEIVLRCAHVVGACARDCAHKTWQHARARQCARPAEQSFERHACRP